MADVYTKAKRSKVMSLIRGRGNLSTEGALAKIFRAGGITGWRRHQPVFGKPDFIIRARRLAVFVDGCFWHCCPKHATIPAPRRAFWVKKVGSNKARDRRVTHELHRCGWRVIRIWEHDLTRPEWCIFKIRRTLEMPVK
jgi:DNA mismatch endonuclease (patch repair protein)